MSARQLTQPTLIAKSDRIVERTEMKNFPVKSLKIDRSFVAYLASAPSHRGIHKPIVVIPEGLNLSIIAEGMEAPAKWESLQAIA